MRQDESLRGERVEARAISLLALVLMVRLWVCPLPASLWRDEAATLWAAGYGLDGWLAAASNSEFPQASLYSLLMTGWVKVIGIHEVGLRLPSVIAALGAGVLLYALCRRMFGPLAAAYSVLLWLSIGEVGRTGPNARPYALALFFVGLALYALVRAGVRWHPGWTAINGLALGAAICASPFTIVAPAAQLAFLGLAAARGWISWHRTIWISPALTGLLALPMISLLLLIRAQTGNHSYVPMPTWTDLGTTWLPPRWVIAAITAWAFTIVFSRADIDVEAHGSGPATKYTPFPRWLFLGLCVTLAAAPAAALFLQSYRAGHSIFVPRYMLSMTIPLAAAVAWALVSVRSTMWRIAAGVSLFAVSMASTGSQLWTVPFQEDWRHISTVLTRARQQDPSVPIVATAAFVEGRFLSMPYSPERARWLLAPFHVYPVPGGVEGISYDLGSPDQKELEAKIDDLRTKPAFYVVMEQDGRLTDWLQNRITGDGRYKGKAMTWRPVVWRFERAD